MSPSSCSKYMKSCQQSISNVYTWWEPSKHARSDLEVFWLRPVVAIMAIVQPKSGRIVYAVSDFPHLFQFRFSKAGMDRIAQNQPRSDLDGLVRIWRNTSGQEASWCAGIIWPGFWQDATGPLPVSHLQTRFCSSRDVPDNIVQKPARIRSSFGWLCRFWPNGSGPEASQCASGKYFPADPDRSRIGSGMFTGSTHFRIKISPWCPVIKLQAMYTDRTRTSQSKQKHSVWVMAKETVRNSWDILITILGHKYHQKTFWSPFWVTSIIRRHFDHHFGSQVSSEDIFITILGHKYHQKFFWSPFWVTNITRRHFYHHFGSQVSSEDIFNTILGHKYHQNHPNNVKSSQ